MGKKAAKKMTMAELGDKFGVVSSNAFPSQSEGKDFTKGKGMGKGSFRDMDNGGDINDWRSSGGKDSGGKGRRGDRDDGTSRAETGDWFAKEAPAGAAAPPGGPRRGNAGGGGGDRRAGGNQEPEGGGGPRRGSGGGGFDRPGSRAQPETEAEKDGNWRSSLGRIDEDEGRKKTNAYVAPAFRKSVEAQKKQKEARETRAAEEAAKKAAAQEERKQLEKQRRQAEKRRREEEALARKETRDAVKASRRPPKEKEVAVSAAELSAFVERCERLIKDSEAEVKAAEADVFAEEAFNSVQPLGVLCRLLLEHSRQKSDEEVTGIVKRFSPLLVCLIGRSTVRRFNVRCLCEIQRLAHEMCFPRLSPESALLEVFFDGLYQAEVIEEDYFEMWAISEDDTPGKTTAMFQLNDFMSWLRDELHLDREAQAGNIEEEEDDEEGHRDEEEDEDEEGPESDIEANVPRASANGLRKRPL